MPKKFGTNTKSQEARERKEAAKELQKSKKAQEEEDKKWTDDDVLVNRKLQRKDEREAKRLEAIKKKQENRKLHDEEMSNLQSAKTKNKSPSANKLTQAQIVAARQRINAQLSTLASKKESQQTDELPENPNLQVPDEASARTVEDAIKVLSVKDDPLEKHPEKRLKNAYQAYEAKMLPILKEENPGMRYSQLKEKIYKSFQTAPENPLNQAHTTYNEK
ncbi:hypothetical protein Aperf_G00000077048 [Anoplocephala perfoliata]